MSILGISWSYVVIRALRFICNIKVEILSAENLPKSPFIIACKHQSVIETAFFLQYLKFPVYVIKKELLSIPFYGWFLQHMGMIPIDRNGGMLALKQLLRACEKSLGENRSVIIFPEGTRVKPFDSVEYQAGIAALHNKFPNTPIIPVAVNSGVFWPKGSWWKYPGTVVLKVLPSVNTKTNKDELLKYLKTTIDCHSDDLCRS
ncbi:lysophospholipid acyltransferase family protein [Candidatus Bandiella euplotis]|nr:lysophospholipid acyltransferase family protein [Candidatus Bandiella woodruffii]